MDADCEHVRAKRFEMVRSGFRGRESNGQAPRESRVGLRLDHRLCCRPGKRARLLQTVKLPIESADVNSTAEYRGRRVYIITNLQTADLFALVSRDRMYPAGFVAEHEATIN